MFANHISDKTELWRIFFGFVIISIFYIVGTIGILSLPVVLGVGYEFGLWSSELGSTPEALALLLLTFLPIWFGVALAMWQLHSRPLSALYGPQYRVNWRHFRKCFVWGLLVISAISVVGVLFEIGSVSINPAGVLDLPKWALWIIPLVVLVLIQSGAEEIVFRGYILQNVKASGRSDLWAIYVPSLLFGLLHFDYQSFGNNAYLYVADTTVFGVLACYVTLRTGNLGAVIGLHLANNSVAMLGFGLDGQMDGAALFVQSLDLKSAETGLYFILDIIFMSAAYTIYARWDDRRKSAKSA